MANKKPTTHPRLDLVKLDGRLTREEEEEKLGRAQRRLMHLRLINGGQLNGGKLGPPG
jgi:hypothetical protein